MTQPEMEPSKTANFIAAYNSPERYYHNLDHIKHCLEEFSEVHSQVTHPHEMWLAIWFHDFVYDIGEDKRNEERSAIEAWKWMTDDAAMKRIVMKLILVTKHSPLYPPMIADECIMCDIDLAIFGAENEYYDQYARNIRKEYASVPDTIYIPARVRILENFLKTNIYYTHHFQNKYQAQARKNLLREIGDLAKQLV